MFTLKTRPFIVYQAKSTIGGWGWGLETCFEKEFARSSQAKIICTSKGYKENVWRDNRKIVLAKD